MEINATLINYLNEREAKLLEKVHREYAIKLVQQIVFGMLTLLGTALMLKFNTILGL